MTEASTMQPTSCSTPTGICKPLQALCRLCDACGPNCSCAACSFCRRCYVYDCRDHGAGQALPESREATAMNIMNTATVRFIAPWR